MPKVNLNKYQPIDQDNKFHWDSYYDQNYDDFDDLPKWESRAANLTRRYGDLYDVFDYRHTPYTAYYIAERILQNNIGRSFDSAFSYYCRKVDQKDQKLFLNKVFSEYHRWRYEEYFVDDDGLIQYKPYRKKYKKEFKVPSFDYKVDYIRIYENQYKWNYPSHRKEIISGSIKEFNCANHLYYRERAIQNSKKRKLEREQKRAKIELEYSFLTKKELLDKEESMRKLISHGFDPKTSFRNH